ncbi:MAG: PIN domain-containing protein [Staphylococcus equorum]|nr:PIN domain-containing protein [Staphylococcus equorum]
MSAKSIVLDANIIIRAVLGVRVRNLLIQHHQDVDFFVPDVCLSDAHKYIPQIFEKRRMPIGSAIEMLDELKIIFNVVELDVYNQHCDEAKERMKDRDLDDWPIVATALVLDCPIWTEDKDFFGSGMSTWTTDRIHIFLPR